MKKSLASMCLSAVLTVAFSYHAVAADLPEIEKSGTLKVATEDDYAPFNFMNNGQADGFNPVLRLQHPEPFPFQVVSEEFQDVLFIVCQQNGDILVLHERSVRIGKIKYSFMLNVNLMLN